MTARIMCLNWLRLVGALFRRSSRARFAHAVYRTTQQIKPLVLAPAVLSVLLFAALQPAQAALLNREDIDKLLDGQFIVGEVQPDLPVYPFAKGSWDAGGKPELEVGYAFESLDFEPIRGYSGKPIDVLVAMDLTGAFIDLRLVDHKEPFFDNPTGTKRLGVFTAQVLKR